MNRFPVKVGKTYWNADRSGPQSCTVLGDRTPEGREYNVRWGFSDGQSDFLTTWGKTSLRDFFPYASERTALARHLKYLEKENDKAYELLLGYNNRIRKVRARIRALNIGS